MPHGGDAGSTFPVDLLLERARRGDASAWDVLIRQHQGKVLAVFLSHRIPLPRAQELAQEVWLKLLAKARAGELQALKLPGLAMREAKFRALDEVRRHDTVPLVDEDGGDPYRWVADRGPGLEERVAWRERMLRMREGIEALPVGSREVFLLFYRDHLPQQEIADRRDISVQRVRSILTECRSRLRAHLEESS